MQEERRLSHSYEEWPPSQSEREELARMLLGERFVSVYDSWIKTAKRTLFQGYQPKAPTEQQQGYLTWIENLPEDERYHALSLIREIISGVVFSTLNVLDNNSGFVLHDGCWERMRILLDIMPRDENGYCLDDNPRETLGFNSDEGANLHERWHEWLSTISSQLKDSPI